MSIGIMMEVLRDRKKKKSAKMSETLEKLMKNTIELDRKYAQALSWPK